jgi:two-component system nitrogen regulation response regulator NtrX
MSLKTQSKVLRVLQDGEAEPVGAGRSLRVDVRVLAATNKPLPEEIQAGRFREDLYFRLNVIPIPVPALRERREDIPLLARHFIGRWCEQNGRRPPELDAGAEAALKAHAWTGNVRELRNAVERLLIMGDGQRLDAAQVEAVLGAGSSPASPADAAAQVLAVAPQAGSLKEFRDAAERTYLVSKLRELDWNVSATARAIGTPRSNLYKKLEAYGIRRETDGGA